MWIPEFEIQNWKIETRNLASMPQAFSSAACYAPEKAKS
jgi:hypothetical protein